MSGYGSLGYGQSKSRNQSYVDRQQTPYFGDLYSRIQTLTNQSTPQSTVAGFTPFQQIGQQLGAQSAGNVGGLVNNTNQAFNQALDPSSAFGGLYQNALQSTFNPILNSFTQSVLPNLQQDAVGVGQVGSSRHGLAQGQATQGLFDTLGNIGNQFAFDTLNRGMSSRDNALGLANQIGAFNFLPSQALMDIGGQQQMQNQRYLDAPFDILSRYASILGDPTVLNEGRSRSYNFTSSGGGGVSGGGGGGY